MRSSRVYQHLERVLGIDFSVEIKTQSAICYSSNELCVPRTCTHSISIFNSIFDETLHMIAHTYGLRAEVVW